MAKEPLSTAQKIDQTPRRAGQEFTRLLWTGGWDSTFRLLQLLLDEERSVEPHYIVDFRRRSASLEQERMKEIRSRLAEFYPGTRRLLRPSRIVDVRDIPLDDQVHGSLLRLVSRWNIGSQYGWIARYCGSEGLTSVEMALEWPGTTGEMMVSEAKRHLRKVSDEFGHGYEIAPDARESDMGRVFRYFRFPLPLFELRKTDVQAIAAQRGWTEIMNLTWFCHCPLGSGTPCGLCPPCRHTIEAGMGWRVPLRLRLRFYSTPHGVRFVLRNHPRLYAAAGGAYRLRRSFAPSSGATIAPSGPSPPDPPPTLLSLPG